MMGILMIVWGTISGSMAFVHTPIPFLTLRFLLGVAEAGFYPSDPVSDTVAFRAASATSFTAWFIFAIPLANIFGGPLSTLILQHGSVGAMRDWQVLLLTEAIPRCTDGIPTAVADDRHTQDCGVVSRARSCVTAEVRARDEYPSTNHENADTHDNRFQALQHRLSLRILLSLRSTLRFSSLSTHKVSGSRSFWSAWESPLAVSGGRLQQCMVVSAVGMLVWGRMADRGASKKWTLAVPLLIAAVGYALTPLAIHASAGTGGLSS